MLVVAVLALVVHYYAWHAGYYRAFKDLEYELETLKARLEELTGAGPR